MPLARFGLDESDADGEGEAEDCMKEAQNIWEGMKVRKYGFENGESIGRVKVSTNMNRNSGVRGGGIGSSAGSKNLFKHRDVRETHFGGWRGWRGWRGWSFFFLSRLRLCLLRGVVLSGQALDRIVGFRGLMRRCCAFPYEVGWRCTHIPHR